MAGLFLSFSLPDKNAPKPKKKPDLPPRDDISEDSMEDMVSDFDAEAPQTKQMIDTRAQQTGHSKTMSIDTDTILRNANQQIETSMTSEQDDFGRNAIPLPDPISSSIQITDQYLQRFKQTQNFEVYKVICNFFPNENRHLQVNSGEIVSGVTEENGWILCFKDVSPNHFGFVPKNYLKFERKTNESTITPRSDLTKSAKAQNEPSPA